MADYNNETVEMFSAVEKAICNGSGEDLSRAYDISNEIRNMFDDENCETTKGIREAFPAALLDEQKCLYLYLAGMVDGRRMAQGK